jgi:hypothetical protein
MNALAIIKKAALKKKAQQSALRAQWIKSYEVF